MDPVIVRSVKNPVLQALISSHPDVQVSTETGDRLEFHRATWNRTLSSGNFIDGASGLVEIMDNNPLVCADDASVPPPAVTLALIALSPLFRAGLVLEDPVVQTSAPLLDDIDPRWWRSNGWEGEVEFGFEPLDSGRVYAAQAMALTPTLSDWDEIDLLYEEAYGRSFYVVREEKSPWDIDLVHGRPYAVYRVRLTPDDGASLLTVQVMADQDGKCGAAQMLHMFNLMNGFEECSGIPDRLPI